jgi:hypothetical protein
VRPIVRIAVSALTSFAVFAILNYWTYRQSRAIICDDCLHSYGFPFSWFAEGGFVYTRAILWRGVVTDIVAMVTFAALISWAWSLVLRIRR